MQARKRGSLLDVFLRCDVHHRSIIEILLSCPIPVPVPVHIVRDGSWSPLPVVSEWLRAGTWRIDERMQSSWRLTDGDRRKLEAG
jgi:hypothetical protein